MGVAHVAIQFPLYEAFKAKLAERHHRDPTELPAADLVPLRSWRWLGSEQAKRLAVRLSSSSASLHVAEHLRKSLPHAAATSSKLPCSMQPHAGSAPCSATSVVGPESLSPALPAMLCAWSSGSHILCRWWPVPSPRWWHPLRPTRTRSCEHTCMSQARGHLPVSRPPAPRYACYPLVLILSNP